ncbi:MAG: PilZ domain-containing protein [Thermodesulfobacteriota bacterium]|nr:PilZ domain-containing protein [Thermodesulfobacteriota bacterium]
MTSTKRRHERIESLNLLSYACVDEAGEIVAQGMGRTLNVSEGGIMLETHESISTSRIRLTIGFKDDVTEVEGQVAYTKEGGNQRSQTGIEFVRPDAEASNVIKRYIEAFNRQAD